MKYTEFAPRVQEQLAAQREDIAYEDRLVLRALGQWRAGVLEVKGLVNADGSTPTARRASAPYIAAVSSCHESPAERLYAVYVASSGLRYPDSRDIEVFAEVPAAYQGSDAHAGYIPLRTEPIAQGSSLEVVLADGHPDIMTVNGNQVLSGYMCDVFGE